MPVATTFPAGLEPVALAAALVADLSAEVDELAQPRERRSESIKSTDEAAPVAPEAAADVTVDIPERADEGAEPLWATHAIYQHVADGLMKARGAHPDEAAPVAEVRALLSEPPPAAALDEGELDETPPPLEAEFLPTHDVLVPACESSRQPHVEGGKEGTTDLDGDLLRVVERAGRVAAVEVAFRTRLGHGEK